MTLKEINKLIDTFYNYHIAEGKNVKEKRTCESYLGGVNGDEKFCKCTTQNSCSGCRFYQPSHWAKMEGIANYLYVQDEEIKALKKDMTKLQKRFDDYIDRAEPILKAYQKIMDAMRA